MRMSETKFPPIHTLRYALGLSVSALLCACGGGGSADVAQTPSPVSAQLATGATTLQLDAAPSADLAVQPSFHTAPVLLDEPDASDSFGNGPSAWRRPHSQTVPPEFRHLASKRLTLDALRATRARALQANANLTPDASASTVVTYTPAQIRAAYGLPTLPALGASLSTAQAAQLGAGQTIYIIDAQSDPNVVAELSTFNTKFGLPACTTKTISSTPLAAANPAACEFSVVYSSASGTITTAAPVYNAGWATEIALDVQWAHATAPLARIVLIEAPSSSGPNLVAAINLANAMGPGVVSMSFGGPESSGYTASVSAAFSAANMSYLAATGDNGEGVEWPSVDSHVLGVGATTLSWTGSGKRSEVAWSGTGGGISQYTATPSYQTNTVPGMGTPAHREVADVAFNGDPNSGQYVAVIPSGSSTASWLSVGGTSLSTPQWAGLLAIANAQRNSAAKAPLGMPHSALYQTIATVPGNFAAAFADVTSGSDGSCSFCTGKLGYDTLTGLGTPNASSLLSQLSGVAAAPLAPVVSAASISGQVGTALSFTVAASDANPLSYSLSGAPSGMAIASSTGVVTWPAPVAGSYAVTVLASDAKTGLSGSAVYSITIAAPQPPVVAATTIVGKPGVALSFTVSATDANPMSYSISGAPSGMALASSTGVVTWANPVLGTYSITVTAKDTKTGLSSSGIYTIKIAQAGPVISASTLTGVAGSALSGTISFSDSSASALAVTISGAPLGMTFTVASGSMVLNVKWPSPVTGSYSLKVTAVDSAGLSAQLTVPVTITAH